MAENEYLDSTKAQRWLSVADAIRDGCDVDVLTEKVRAAFYKTIQKTGQEIPLSELISLMSDHAKLRQRCDEIDGASDVKSFLVEAALANDNRPDALNRFLNDALQNCLYDIPYLAAKRGCDVNVSEARRKTEEAHLRMIPEPRRMASKFDENPSWKLRKPRDLHVDKCPVDNTKVMLNQSLLIAGYRK